MALKIKWIIAIFMIMQNDCHGEKMRRTVLGVGEWFYKILMSLGTCRDSLLFSQQQIWGRVRMNRIFDIYYRSENDNFKVSRIEIQLVVSDSDVMGFSEEGIGDAKFSATVYLPVNTFVIFYNLKIFTCSIDQILNKENKDEGESSNDGDTINIGGSGAD